MMKNEFVYILFGDYESDPFEPIGTDIFGIFASKEAANGAFSNFFDKKKKEFLNYFKYMDENNYWIHHPKLPFEKEKFLQDVLNIFESFNYTGDATNDYNELRKLIRDFLQENIKNLFLKLKKEDEKYWDLFFSCRLNGIEDFFFNYDSVLVEEIKFNELLDTYRTMS